MFVGFNFTCLFFSHFYHSKFKSFKRLHTWNNVSHQLMVYIFIGIRYGRYFKKESIWGGTDWTVMYCVLHSGVFFTIVSCKVRQIFLFLFCWQDNRQKLSNITQAFLVKISGLRPSWGVGLHKGKKRVKDNYKWNLPYTSFVLVFWIATKKKVLNSFAARKF